MNAVVQSLLTCHSSPNDGSLIEALLHEVKLTGASIADLLPRSGVANDFGQHGAGRHQGRMEETLGTRKRGREVNRRRREEEKKKRSEEVKRKQQIRVHNLGCPGEGAMMVPAYLGVPRPDIGFGYIRLQCIPLSIVSLFGCLQVPPS
jgi:hypothetical protein